MRNIIYALKDPRNDLVCYIGKSSIGKKRALSHLKESHSKLVNDWIEGLMDKWLDVLIVIIEEVENLDDLPDREKYWIEYYFDKNPDLLNIQDKPKNLNSVKAAEEIEEFDNLVRIVYKIPEILRKGRLKRNITQDELSKLIPVSRSTVSLFERGFSVSSKLIGKYILALKGFDIKKGSNLERSRK